ncbi:MAG: PssD/Cps14F family polysaccharide biosynthesis glycosyltransferase [Candidatus Aquicultor sp.]
MRILLVCSSGGHLYELFSLREYWEQYDRWWVTFDREVVESLLANERVITAFYPTTRNVKNLFRNFWLALRIIRELRPQTIISTGSGVAIPFFYAAKLYGIRTIYIESIARTSELSLSGRLIYPVADKFLVQWPELTKTLPKAEYRGRVL